MSDPAGEGRPTGFLRRPLAALHGAALMPPAVADEFAYQRAPALARRYGIKIEPLGGGGFNVWPPAELPLAADAFVCHRVEGWEGVLERIVAYAGMLEKRAES